MKIRNIKKLKRNKKGVIDFLPFYMMILFIFLIYLTIVIKGQTNSTMYPLGQVAQEFMISMNNAEKDNLYLSYAATQSVRDNVYDILSTGNNPDEECGYYMGYPLVNNDTKNCLDYDNSKQELEVTLEEEIERKMIVLNLDTDLNIDIGDMSTTKIKGEGDLVEIPIYMSASGNVYDTTTSQTTVKENKETDVAKRAFLEYEYWEWGNLKESEARAYSLLKNYWDNIGWNEASWSPTKTAWSAAFVSYVIEDFSSSAHNGYINKVYKGEIAGWKFYVNKPLEVGDVICNTRGGDTFDSNTEYMSHCDIVVEVGENEVKTLGGNVNNNVDMKSIAINSNKEIANPKSTHIGVLSKDSWV